MTEEPNPGELPELITKLLSSLWGGKTSLAQAVAGLLTFTSTSISDAIWDIVPNLDPGHTGTYSAAGAIGLTALVQALWSSSTKRRLARRVLRDPERLLEHLLRANRIDVAEEYVRLIELYRDGLMTRGNLGRRFQEVLSDIAERPPSNALPSGDSGDGNGEPRPE